MYADARPPNGQRASCIRRVVCRGTRERSGLDVSKYPAVERCVLPRTAAAALRPASPADVDPLPSEMPSSGAPGRRCRLQCARTRLT